MYASQYFTQISELLRRLPRVILLMLKTNDCLRAVNNALVQIILALCPLLHYTSFDLRICVDKKIKMLGMGMSGHYDFLQL